MDKGEGGRKTRDRRWPESSLQAFAHYHTMPNELNPLSQGAPVTGDCSGPLQPPDLVFS